MATDRSQDFGSTAFFLKCVNPVSGMVARSYNAETNCEVKKTPDECGQTIQIFTRNVVSTHKWQGDITGGSVGGLCASLVGHSVSDPGAFLGNMASPGSVFICTSGRYNEVAGEWANWDGTLENNDGV
jgi:hypothetical protein